MEKWVYWRGAEERRSDEGIEERGSGEGIEERV
jgi:hypothetical protein